MDSLVRDTAKSYKTIKLKQRIIYMKIMFKFKVINVITKIFKNIGLYKMGRVIYHKIKKT